MTNNTIDVVLNALAIEFVYGFDEELGKSVWYDPDRRYIRAGTVEMVLREELLLEPFYTNKLLCQMYDIDEQLYEIEVGGPLKDREVAAKDREDPVFMTPKDKLWKQCAIVAVEEKNPEAIWQYDEQPAYFGIVDQITKPRLGGIFKRYADYFTWSRWDKVLFLSQVPELGKAATYKGQSLTQTGASTGGIVNYDPNSNAPVYVRFMLQLTSILMLKSMFQSVSTVYRRRNYHQIPFRFLDGMFEWFVFLFVSFIFPGCLMFYLYLIFGCEPIV